MAFPHGLPSCEGATFDCNSTTPLCYSPGGLVFATVWNTTQEIAKQCPNSPMLVGSAVVAGALIFTHLGLTNEACKAMVGGGWTRYNGGAIWERLTTWKFPLFQLVANSPRPPLGFMVEGLSFAHFLGDPIGTVADLLRKVDNCQTRAMFWQDRLADELSLLPRERGDLHPERIWKSLAIVIDSFDEWGLYVGETAQQYLLEALPDVDLDVRHRYLDTLLLSADALAADRSTKFVPVVIAQFFFIGSVAIAMVKTRANSDGQAPTMFINIETYSVAFTMQYFWVIFAVIWTSIIGVSQSAEAIPRILGRLRKDLERQFSDYGMKIDLPTDSLHDEDARLYHGGVYSWQPDLRWTSAARNSKLERLVARNPRLKPNLKQRILLATVLPAWPVIQYLIPVTVVAAAAGTGQLISALVPPTGWSCRSTAMMWMSVTWLTSYIISLVPLGGRYRLQFWLTLTKDLLATGITCGIIIATQIGWLNRCDCYTQNGRVALQLPFMPAVQSMLDSRLRGMYPAVVTVGLIIQLVLLPCLLVWRYHAAVQVFLQRDDGTSNLDWLNVFRRRRER